MTADSATQRHAEAVIAPPKEFIPIDFGELWRFRELFVQFAWRDISVRYKQAVLGILWAILTPVLTAAIFAVIFGLLGRLPTDGIPKATFYLSGLTLWLMFATVLQDAAESMVNQSALFTKVYFPRMLLPLSSTAVPLADYAMALLVVIAVAAYQGFTPGPSALWVVPGCVLWAWTAAFGVGLWFAALNVYYRDIGYVLPVIARIGLFASPVVYPVSMIPARWHWLYGLSPAVGPIEWIRWALFRVGPPPEPVLFVSIPVALVLLLSGAWFFRRMEHTFADVV
jgi:lipopolysaccharide transport system permease protein